MMGRTRPRQFVPEALRNRSTGAVVEQTPHLNESSQPSTTSLLGGRSLNFVALAMLTLALTLMGLVMVLSASTVSGIEDGDSIWYYFQRQAMWSGIGIVALGVVMRLDYRRLQPAAPFVLLVTLVALAAVLIPGLGASANGSTRWLPLGPLSVQPAEFAKLAVALFVASLLARRAAYVRDANVTERPVLLVALLTAGLIILQPSQGTAMIVVAIAMIMLFVAGAPWYRVTAITVVFMGLAVALATIAPYRRARVQAVLDPWADPLHHGFQTIQSLVGIASGGPTGVGLGSGRAKLGFLPFAHTDFIFSVVAEELGFIGASAIIIMFLLLAVFGVRTAAAAPDRFGALLSVGLTSWIVLQAFINMGAVMGLLPISGLPLPFMSVGGSSLVVSMTAMGIVLNVARQGIPQKQRRTGDAQGPTTSWPASEPTPATAGPKRLKGLQ